MLSKDGVRTPAEARRAGRPVVLMLDGIHPGEVEGKEASLALVRDLLDGRVPWLPRRPRPPRRPALQPRRQRRPRSRNRRLDLKKLTGQPGPLVGTRTQSHGINLNRDYLRQAAPEMRLLQAGVCIPWAPDLTIDNHATNGSVHRFHMTVDVPHTVASGRAEPIAMMRDRLVPEVIAAVRARGFESGWYGNFVEDERVLDADGEVDPDAPVGLGWMTYPHHPRFGSNYRGLTNRLDLLLECYSYLPFEERVRRPRRGRIETLRWAAAHADAVREVVARQRPAAGSRGGPLPARRRRRPRGRPHAQPRARSRARPSRCGSRTSLASSGPTVVDRPRAYLVPPRSPSTCAATGSRSMPAEGVYDVEVARVESLGAEGGRAILEAANVGEVGGAWTEEARRVPDGWSRVDTDQPLGAIAVYLCEPESDDGAVENGLVPAPRVGDDYPIRRVT